MTKLLIDSNTLTGIANQIRYKEESSAPIQVSQMAQRIHDLPSGGISQVESVTINNKAALSNITMAADGTYRDYLIDVSVLPADAPQMTQVTLSDTSIATVKDNGDGTHSLRVKNGGVTTVTVSDYSGTITDSFTMTVNVALQDISFPYNYVEVAEGETRQLTVNFKPHNASNKSLVWSSSSQDVTVDQNGLVTASASGNATISAYNAELDKTITVNVAAIAYVDNPDWEDIQSRVRNGEQPYGIGSEIVVNWKQYTSASAFTQRQLTFVVMHYGTVEDENGNQKPGMYLQTKELLPNYIYFENEQRVKATEETAQEGVYYYGNNGSTYTALNLETGDVIPYELYTNVYKSGIDFSKNINQITQSGLGWWKDSSIRQYLNSESTAQGFGFESQHITDYNQNTSLQGGFLRGFDADFIAALTPIKVSTARNNVVWSQEIDVTYDKMFLPSNEQVYANRESGVAAGVEGEAWDYYKAQIGTTSPTNSAAPARVKQILGGTSANYWWLRSANRTNATSEYYIHTSGSRSYYTAYNYYYAAPACVIC